ncbi:hypothetical protein ACTG9Q_32075 [Actinokineospora sp. 24-640]
MPVHAAPGDLTCTENETVPYSTGLLTTRRPVDVSVHNVLSRTSLTDPAITQGHVRATIHGLNRSCTDLAASGSGSYTITWNTGETSTISYNRSANYVLGALVIVENGTVTAGKFTGDSTTHSRSAACVPSTPRWRRRAFGLVNPLGQFSHRVARVHRQWR